MEKIIPKIVPKIKKVGKVFSFLSKKIPKAKKETIGKEIKKPNSAPRAIV